MKQEIFVRAHTVIHQKQPPKFPVPAKWASEALIFDTETTMDTAQKINFGLFRRCKLSPQGYQCVEEGIFYRDDLDDDQKNVLEQFVANPGNTPQLDVKRFPPPMRLSLYTCSEFVERVYWKSVRKGAVVVGFNLPFDLARLAVKSGPSKKDDGWSFALSLRKNRETGEMEINPERPRIVVSSKNGTLAFIKLGSIRHRDEWPGQGRFLDLRTFGWALRNEGYTLQALCDAFGVPGKLDHKPTGKVTPEEIAYCRQDVRATTSALNAMKKEFDRHPFELRPEWAYSPASIAKAYLDAMVIKRPKENAAGSDEILGIAMQAYYGGRAECRIRKIPVPVVLVDFTSEYPTVNALLKNWDVLRAESVSFEECTADVREMVGITTLDDTFQPSFWKNLSFFALVLPDKDAFPVRTVYNGRTQNIGLNYLSAEKPIWYAGPDVIVSALLTGKPPRILKAFRMVPRGKQSEMKPTNLAGMVAIDPARDEIYTHMVEQKNVHKRTNKPLSDFLKILANSGSYGLFVEMNPEKLHKAIPVQVFSGETVFEDSYTDIEKTGHWYFPPLASLITSGGRLLLAMLEECVGDFGGSYLFCDTDSLCIVSSEDGGFIPCPGGPYRLENGVEAVKALSWEQVAAISRRFNALNPYRCDLVRDLLKIEDVNFLNFDPSKPQRQLFGYAISAKRYALYTQTGDDISIVKASGHGLGYLYSPKEGFNERMDAPAWIVEAWDWLLRKELGFACTEPAWLDFPAMMRIAVTSPNILRNSRPDWLAPYNFFLLPLISALDGYPACCDETNFKFICPFESNRTNWKRLTGINLCDGQEYRVDLFPNGKQDAVVPDSFRIVLRHYLRRPESKSLAPDGSPCVAETVGLLKRASIVAGEIVPVGKETDRRWEQNDDPSLLDFKVLEYRKQRKTAVADSTIARKIQDYGVRKLARDTGISQHTIEAIKAGKPVRRSTLKRVLTALKN